MTTPPQDVYEAAARARDDVALAEWGLRGRTDWIDQPGARAAIDAAVVHTRAQVAAEIRAHANRFAPKDGNGAQRRLRRHLLIAARVAAGRPTLEEAAQAFTQWAARIAEGGQTP